MGISQAEMSGVSGGWLWYYTEEVRLLGSVLFLPAPVPW